MLLSVLRIRITLGVLIDGLSKICAEKFVADLSVKVQSDQTVLFDGVIDDNFCTIGDTDLSTVETAYCDEYIR